MFLYAKFCIVTIANINKSMILSMNMNMNSMINRDAHWHRESANAAYNYVVYYGKLIKVKISFAIFNESVLLLKMDARLPVYCLKKRIDSCLIYSIHYLFMLQLLGFVYQNL